MDYSDILNLLEGKTIAIVYTFEGEKALGFSHYHIWKSDVISDWMKAIQEIRCLPFILDVRTFVEKAMMNTLPTIDFVINLNCGNCDLSPMGLIPSVCGFLSIPCIPCNAETILLGENKNTANIIAKALGLKIPNKLTNNNGIYRPLNYGSSFGVKRVSSINQKETGIYQEFINGYDITTPFVFNPITKVMEPLPTIIYLPNNSDKSWFFDNVAKETKSGYTREIIPEIEDTLIAKYRDLMNNLSINTFCRIDARIKCKENEYLTDIQNYKLKEENTYFIEINSMPTVREGNSFDFSFKALSNKHPLNPLMVELKKLNRNLSVHTVLLICAISAHIKAMY